MKIQHLILILFLAGGIALLNGCATSSILPSRQADTDVIAIGDWSKPVSDGKGNFTYTLRGRLLVYAPYVSDVKRATNYGHWYPHARVYLELQQIEPEHAWQEPVEIYYNPGFGGYSSEEQDGFFKFQKNASGVVTNVIQMKFQRDATGAITNFIQEASHITNHQYSVGLQIRDGNDKPYPNEITTINGSLPAPCWVTLPCDSTVRLRADLYTLANSKKPDGLEILVNGGGCTIPPHATNDYYLCGTFSPPTNHPSPLNYHVWQGTLNLPRVKIPTR